jgi:general secretion pathway protein J
MMHARRRSAEAGFTLIETLAATALFLVVIGILATITGQWLPAWNHGFARVQRSEHMALGIERIVADLAAAEYITPNSKIKRPIFDGDALAVTLVRSAVGPNSQPGLEIVRLAEIAGDSGPVLARAAAPFVPLEPDASAIPALKFFEPVVLVRPPFRVAFAFAGADLLWQPIWRGADQLPRAVQVTIRNTVTGQTLMVSSVSRVHVTAPAECANPKSKNCDNTANPQDQQAGPPANNPAAPQNNTAAQQGNAAGGNFGSRGGM